MMFSTMQGRTRLRCHVMMGCAVLLLGLAACDTIEPGELEEHYVVESYLVAGEPLPQIRLSRTAPVDEIYDFTSLAVEDATVYLRLMDEEGGVDRIHPYRPSRRNAGVYLPEEEDVLVQPLRRYRLDITTPDQERITAETVVPDTFRIVEASAEEVVYQGAEQLELTVTPSRSPGREQSYYIFVTEALEANEDNLTPLAGAIIAESGGELEVGDLSVGTSSILNEGNYTPNPDGTLTISLPWVAIAFYGANRITINALDDSLYDFLRSQRVQQGGSTFAPGEIPNPIERVDGARGVFGSYARVSYDVVVQRSPESGPDS